MDVLPDELVLDIFRFVSAHDLTQVGLACKHLNRIATFLLWTNIELHSEGYHEAATWFVDSSPTTSPPKRRYLSGEPKDARVMPKKGQALFTTLQQYQADGNSRLSEICARVVSLCTVLVPVWRAGGQFWPGIVSRGVQVWELFPFFTRLEVLELYGDAIYESEYEELLQAVTAPQLPTLRHAKLFGYIPRPFANWILRSAATLQRLELGLLDRPISSRNRHASPFRPLPEENLSLVADDDNSYEESDYGSLDGDYVIPRPLGQFLPTSAIRSDGSQAEYSLPELKYLHLCQPAKGKSDDTMLEYSWSTRADEACLMDWRQLLLASSQTVEVLVLEQRSATACAEDDSNAEFMRWNEKGIGSKALVNMIEGVLSSSETFPMLRTVYLFGISVGLDAEGNEMKHNVEIVPGYRLMQHLKRLDIACEARLGTWCKFDEYSGCTWWSDWAADPDYEGDEDRWDTVLATV